jgi:hypothetical protein
MEYAAALEAVKALENGSELIEAITGEINKKGGENKSLRDRLKPFDGVDPEKYRSITSALQEHEIDLAADIKEQIAALKASAGSKSQVEQQVAALNAQLKTIQKSLEDERGQRTAAESKIRTERLANKMLGLFSESVANPEITLDYHIGKGTFTLVDDDMVEYKRAGGEAVVGKPADVLSAYLADNPKQAINTQKGGAGSPPAGGTSAKGAVMKRSEWEKLSTKERGAFFTNGGTLKE